MKRSKVIDNANIKAGDDRRFGFFGQATYEKSYNGGSNGLTSARHDVFEKYLATKYPESFDAAVPEDLIYSGQVKLTDAVENLNRRWTISAFANENLCTDYQENFR
jgi:phosphoribosylformylglycinamidine cyclo-ligase